MIRLSKPVQILQWGEGTSQGNQRWIEIAKGRFQGKPKTVLGITTLQVEVEGSINKVDAKREQDFIKVMQQGEAMTPHSERWGEVAMGTLKQVAIKDGRTVVEIELKAATKFAN
jgi:hypothetical protein